MTLSAPAAYSTRESAENRNCQIVEDGPPVSRKMRARLFWGKTTSCADASSENPLNKHKILNPQHIMGRPVRSSLNMSRLNSLKGKKRLDGVANDQPVVTGRSSDVLAV
jgi:hypothetical protein